MRGFLLDGGAAERAAGEEVEGASRTAVGGAALRFFSAGVLVVFGGPEEELATGGKGAAADWDVEAVGADEQPKSRWSETACSVVILPHTGLFRRVSLRARPERREEWRTTRLGKERGEGN